VAERFEGKKLDLCPMKGEKKDLLEMACENAEQYLLEKMNLKGGGETPGVLKEKLHLKKIPRRIEGLDISNYREEMAVGSMVFFENGKASKERYRHFKIKTIEGADRFMV